MSKYESAMKIMGERFGHDSFISVATVDGGRPYVRTVDGYFMDGAIYVVTYALSNKMKQIAVNNDVAVCGDWFTAHGIGENLGYVMDEKNAETMAILREAFSAWYTGGHVDESDVNTCLLRIKLTTGVLIDNDVKYGDWRYEVDFANKTAT